MSAPSPVDAPQHILDLLSDLHQKSLKQEAAMSSAKKGKVFSTEVLGDLKDQKPSGSPQNEFDQLMRDKFIALVEDKYQFTYQLINAMGATDVIEAGTNFRVSTIYLALAVAKRKAARGKSGIVIVTEKREAKCGDRTQVLGTMWCGG
ncbi:hypothetical protein DTO271G3_5622 [Paecilomyces variotii]|nr:hypothetical protein DTO271G3_5622 [Paecilomyces variotii]